MKICILSMQQVNNYGSVLQAYSLKKILEDLGNEVEFIEISKGEDEALNLQCRSGDIVKNNDGWAKTQIRRVKGRFSGRKIKKVFSDFRNEERLNSVGGAKNFDVCVIGSDEVFNCLQKAKWGFSSQLFGNVKNAQKVITYAASCGYTQAELLSEELKSSIISAMSNLEAISVRDENTAEFVQKLSGRKVVYNLDPVAVGNFEKELEHVELESKLPPRFCIVYSYSKRINSPKEIQAISDYCKKNKLKIVAPFGKQDWIPSYEPLTPFELIKAFQTAECVVTDTFHGALFGAKFGKKMAILIRDSNRNKLLDLTQRLQIENHVVTDMSQFEMTLNQNLNKENIQNILAIERTKTFEYLQDNL